VDQLQPALESEDFLSISSNNDQARPQFSVTEPASSDILISFD